MAIDNSGMNSDGGGASTGDRDVHDLHEVVRVVRESRAVVVVERAVFAATVSDSRFLVTGDTDVVLARHQVGG